MKIAMASADRGRITAQGVSVSPSLFTITNSGTMITWIGTVIVTRISTNSRSRPGNLYLAKAYPPSILVSTVTITAPTVITALLRNHVTIGWVWKAVAKLSQFRLLGHR